MFSHPFCNRIACSPSHIRNKPTFAHKLCIRVAVDKKNKTLSITDFGSGMTRADLINGIGIGHLSHRALVASKGLAAAGNNAGSSNASGKEQDETMDDGDTVASEDDETSVDDYSDSSEAAEDESDDLIAGLPCRSLDIGGFYSALCSLGTQVCVGTKVSL